MPVANRLRELICRMYEQLGRDCSELGYSPGSIISQFHAAYDIAGAPLFDTPETRSAFIADLDATIALINGADSPLTSSEDAELRALISKIRSDIGA